MLLRYGILTYHLGGMSMAKKVGVVLSGSGVFDGSELHEAVLTLYFLDRAGVEAVIMAPDKKQMHVVNHLTGEVMPEERNVLVESARIARGKISPLSAVSAADIDGLIFPGGFGAAKNLCTYAVDGAAATVDADVARITAEMLKAKKPVAAICIAPVLVAKVLAEAGLKGEVTIGTDSGVAGDVESFGQKHVACPVKEFVVDEKNKVITSPAYMLGQSISEVAVGIEKTVNALVGMV